MDKTLADILKKLSPFTAEEQKIIDESIVTEELRLPFTVTTNNNYHPENEAPRYIVGQFKTWEEAVTIAKEIVDIVIVFSIRRGREPEGAVDEFLLLGEDPEIICEDSVTCEESFSAISYAEERSRELYEAEQKSRTPVKEGRPRKVGRPMRSKSTRSLKEVSDGIAQKLVRNLNANVLREHENKNGEKND